MSKRVGALAKGSPETEKLSGLGAGRSYAAMAWRRFRRNRSAVFGLGILMFYALAAVFGPMISPYNYASQNLLIVNQGPSWAHWLGTDQLGRDFLTRILLGARTAFLVGTIATTGANGLGLLLGSLAAYAGGWVDMVVMRLADACLSLPYLLLALFFSATITAPVAHAIAWLNGGRLPTQGIPIDFLVVLVALSFAGWPGTARLVRGEILTIREHEFIAAAQAVGASRARVLWRHIVPNAIGPIIVQVSVGFGSALLAESALSYLGLGVEPPTPSWGSMISQSILGWQLHPHLIAVPGIALAIAVFAANTVGDGLNDALDPRSS